MSPFKQLKVQTHALRAEPHNTQVATEQRTLLQQQIVAMGLIMQQRQLEQQLDQVKQQLQEVQKGRETGCADVISKLGSPAQPDQCYSPQLEQQQQQQPSPAARMPLLSKQSRLAQGASSSPQGAPWDPCPAGPRSSAFQQHLEAGGAAAGTGYDSPAAFSQEALAELNDDAAGSPALVARSSSASSSAASTPRSSNASSSGDSCTDILNELSDLALDFQNLATASHQASTFKAVSASTLQHSQQQQLLQTTIAASSTPGGLVNSTAVSSVASPHGAQQQQRLDSSFEQLDGGALLHAAVALDADAAVKLQADLQVSSAYELAATRGLLHAGAVVQELRSTLANSKHSQHNHRQQQQHRKHTAGKGPSAVGVLGSAQSPGSRTQGKQQQRRLQEGAESPPVVRTLFSTQDGADAADARASLEAAVAAAAAKAAGGADATAGSSASPQQQGVSVLRQLQQQQQYIIELLGNLSATQQQRLGAVPGGSPTQDPLQQLADAQQQLQVLLHAAGAVIQDAHTCTAGSSGDSRQQVVLLVGSGAGFGPDSASRQGSGAWAVTDAVAGVSMGSSPTRQQRKFDGPPLLQVSSPDQQQLRDSSPDKLRRRQRAWLLPGAAASPTAQRLGDCSPAAGSELQDSRQTWSAQPPADHMQEREIDQLLQENTQMKGQMVCLKLQLQRAQQEAREAESLINSCNSLGMIGRRSTTPDHAWAHRSQDSVSTPGGAASGAATGFSTGATAAFSSSAGTPTQLVLLSGKNKELHALCMQREAQVRQLENELRRLQHELKQQALAAAPAAFPPAGSSAAGGLTPRGAATPRHGLASIAGPGPSLFSPQRRAVSSPGAAGTPRSLSSAGAAAYGAPAGPQAAVGNLTIAVPQAHQAPAPTRFASGGGAQAGHLEMQSWLGQPYGHLPAVVESAPQGHRLQEQQQQREVGYSAAAVRASLDEVSCASTSSSRSRGKGIRVGCGKPPLHVPSLKRK